MTRKQVWYTLLDVAHQSRYFNELADLALARHRRRLALHAVVATGVVTAFLEAVPSWISITIYALAVVFSLHSLVADYSLDFATVRMVGNRCRELEVKVRGLWLETANNRKAAPAIETRWYELAQDLARAKDAAGATRTNTLLSVRTAREAAKFIEEELV